MEFNKITFILFFVDGSLMKVTCRVESQTSAKCDRHRADSGAGAVGKEEVALILLLPWFLTIN